jgi:flagellar biosynthesis regulator FlaF
MVSAKTISADTVRNREAEFLIASASRIENIQHTDTAALPHLADALAENLHVWNLISDKILSDPNSDLPSSLHLQVTALAIIVLRYTHSALEAPTSTALHMLVTLNRELAAEFCAESIS